MPKNSKPTVKQIADANQAEHIRGNPTLRDQTAKEAVNTKPSTKKM